MSAPQFTKGPWEVGYRALEVRAGPMKICDIRGWGYLTGKGGALALPDDEAIAIQTANANLIAAAPRMYELLETINRFASPKPDRTLGEYANELEVIAILASSGLALARGESHD